MKRIILTFISIFIILFAMSFTVYAVESIDVLVNGEKVEFDVEPIIYTERVFVPIRAVCEKMGADVYWLEFEHERNAVLIVKNDIKIALEPNVAIINVIKCEGYEEFIGWIEETIPIKDDDTIVEEMDVPPIIVDCRTLLPIRAICEALGATVMWDESTSTVLIEYLDADIKNTDTEFFVKFYEFLMGDLELQKAYGNIREGYKYETTVTFEKDNYEKAFENTIANKLEWSGNFTYNFEYTPTEIKVIIKHDDEIDNDYIKRLFVKPTLRFTDAYQNEILGASNISGISSDYDENLGYYIEISLDEEGRQKFAAASEAISMKPDGENHISVMLDDSIITAPTVNQKIDSDKVRITGNFLTLNDINDLVFEMESALYDYEIVIKDIHSVSLAEDEKY